MFLRTTDFRFAMSLIGTFRTSAITLTMSAHRVKPDIAAAFAGRAKLV
jgi:hypothetical protein